MNLIIREMKREDIDNVAKLYYQGFWDKLKTLEDLPYENAKGLIKDFLLFNEDNFKLYKVAKVDENVIGMIKLLSKEDKEIYGNINEKDKKEIGYIKLVKAGIVLKIFEHSVKKDNLYIDTVVVDDSYRGSGIGGKLLLEAFKETERKGKKKTSLVVIKRNENAKKLYENMGFEVTKVGRSKMLRKLSNIDGYYFMERKL